LLETPNNHLLNFVISQVIRGTMLLKLMAGSFAPSQALENFVELWMRSFAREYRMILNSTSSSASAYSSSASSSESTSEAAQQRHHFRDMHLENMFGDLVNEALLELHRTVFRGTARVAVAHESIEAMLAPLVIGAQAGRQFDRFDCK
jgi:hypothetical protein